MSGCARLPRGPEKCKMIESTNSNQAGDEPVTAFLLFRGPLSKLVGRVPCNCLTESAVAPPKLGWQAAEGSLTAWISTPFVLHSGRCLRFCNDRPSHDKRGHEPHCPSKPTGFGRPPFRSSCSSQSTADQHHFSPAVTCDDPSRPWHDVALWQ